MMPRKPSRHRTRCKSSPCMGCPRAPLVFVGNFDSELRGITLEEQRPSDEVARVVTSGVDPVLVPNVTGGQTDLECAVHVGLQLAMVQARLVMAELETLTPRVADAQTEVPSFGEFASYEHDLV